MSSTKHHPRHQPWRRWDFSWHLLFVLLQAALAVLPFLNDDVHVQTLILLTCDAFPQVMLPSHPILLLCAEPYTSHKATSSPLCGTVSLFLCFHVSQIEAQPTNNKTFVGFRINISWMNWHMNLKYSNGLSYQIQVKETLWATSQPLVFLNKISMKQSCKWFANCPSNFCIAIGWLILVKLTEKKYWLVVYSNF